MERTDWLEKGFDAAQAQFLMVTAITHHRVSSPLWGKDEVRKLHVELEEIASAAAEIETPEPPASPRPSSPFSSGRPFSWRSPPAEPPASSTLLVSRLQAYWKEASDEQSRLRGHAPVPDEPHPMTTITSNHEDAAGGSPVGGRPAEGPAWPGRWRALTVGQVAAFMTLLDVSIVNVALPSIERDLGASAARAQWVVSGYALAFALALVPAGRLGDALGRRQMFLFALTAFVGTSALSGAAPTTELLIAARLLQGVAGGMLLPQNSGLIQELFSGAERGRAFGFLGGTVGLATAAGPVIGGLILAAFAGPDGWRWIFYVNLPIGLIALALAARLLPKAARTTWRGLQLDLVGALLLGGGVLCLLLPLVDATDGGLTRMWPLFGLAVVLVAGFVWWEARTVRQGGQPLLDPRLTHTSGYVPGLAIGLVYFIGFTGIWLVLALYLQDGLGYSPLRSGLTVTPFALGVAASAVVAGRLVVRVGRWLTVSGLTMTVVGLAATALVLRQVGGDRAGWAAAGPLLLAGLGGGMVTSPNITLTLESVPVPMAGAAGGALQTAQRIGAAIGTALLVSFFYRMLTGSGHNWPTAVSDALLCACGLMVLALVLAVAELWHRHTRHDQPATTHPSGR